MKTNFRNIWKIIPVLLITALFTTVGYARTYHGLKGDLTGEVKMKVGAEIMVSAEHLLMASLESYGLTKDSVIAKGNAMLTTGEKMILDGKAMMMHAATRIKGKELMMQGSTRMMEGKDFIMNELNNERLQMASILKEKDQELTDSEGLMLDGKNLMMDGERNFK